MLLELAEEADENKEDKDLADPGTYIPGSDGEVSDEEIRRDSPCRQAEEPKLPEPIPKRKKMSVPGMFGSAEPLEESFDDAIRDPVKMSSAGMSRESCAEHASQLNPSMLLLHLLDSHAKAPIQNCRICYPPSARLWH